MGTGEARKDIYQQNRLVNAAVFPHRQRVHHSEAIPLSSSLSGPVLIVPGSALDREDGRFQVELEQLGGVMLVASNALCPYICSVTGIPYPKETRVLKPFAPHQALVGTCISEQGWDMVKEFEDPVALLLWPQNAPDYRAPSPDA